MRNDGQAPCTRYPVTLFHKSNDDPSRQGSQPAWRLCRAIRCPSLGVATIIRAQQPRQQRGGAAVSLQPFVLVRLPASITGCTFIDTATLTSNQGNTYCHARHSLRSLKRKRTPTTSSPVMRQQGDRMRNGSSWWRFSLRLSMQEWFQGKEFIGSCLLRRGKSDALLSHNGGE
jgi:hypothetical protein